MLYNCYFTRLSFFSIWGNNKRHLPTQVWLSRYSYDNTYSVSECCNRFAESKGLSDGEAAGVVIGIILAFVLIIGAVFGIYSYFSVGKNPLQMFTDTSSSPLEEDT